MTKRMLRLHPAGAFHRDERDLDRRSAAGVQLRKAGLLQYEFTADASVVFRHVLDYAPACLGDAEQQRRKSAYLQAGWEAVEATPSAWHVYRRPVQADLPEEAYAAVCPRSRAEERQIAIIWWLSALRVPVVAAGAVLAAISLVRGKGLLLPALIFLLSILVLTLRIQAMQERLKP